jgi:hypothetical protein
MSAGTHRFAALVCGEDGALHVRRYETAEEAYAASAARCDEGVVDDLDPAQIKFAHALCRILATAIPGLRIQPTHQVLTLAEAIAYTKQGNVWSYYRWCREHGVQAITRGRYSRRALDGGLRDECRGAGRRIAKQSTPSEAAPTAA